MPTWRGAAGMAPRMQSVRRHRASGDRGERRLDRRRGAFRHAHINQPLLRQYVDMRVRIVAARAEDAEELRGVWITPAVAKIDEVGSGRIQRIMRAPNESGGLWCHVATRCRIEPPLRLY
jgi:hypothetical protein